MQLPLQQKNSLVQNVNCAEAEKSCPREMQLFTLEYKFKNFNNFIINKEQTATTTKNWAQFKYWSII